MNLFYAATTITNRNAKIAPFWDSLWLNGEKPKDIVPLIFEASKNKNKPCIHNGWVANIKMDANLTVSHIHEYIRLWVRLRGVHLHEIM
jgi:hypothetical protein